MAKNASLSRQALIASGALRAYLMPRVAADTKIDLTSILKPVTSTNWKSQKGKIKVALDKALVGKLAQDADISDIIEMLDQLEEMVEADPTPAVDADPDDDDDDEEEKKKKAKEAAEKLKEAAAEDSDDDDDKKDDEEDDDDKKKPAFLKDKKGAKDKAAKDKAAMDAAISAAVSAAVRTATRTAENNTIARLRSIAEAEKAVRPYIGELAVAQDSAEAVYKIALDAAEVDLDGVPPAAYSAMVKMLPLPGEVKPVRQARVAMDAATNADLLKRFPGALALKQR